MSYRDSVSVSYNVEVRMGGLGLALFAVLGGGRSVHEVLVGGVREWGPPAQLEPWLDQDSDSASFGGLLGGALRLGEEVEVDWQ